MSDNIITGIYPGTFDPVTYGHLDIIFRATHIVNKLVIPEKNFDEFLIHDEQNDNLATKHSTLLENLKIKNA